MLKDTNPSLVKKNGHGTPVVNWQKFTEFAVMAQCIFWQIEKFICYPVLLLGTEKQATIEATLYKTGSAASKASHEQTIYQREEKKAIA
jgi:hypothetical protein